MLSPKIASEICIFALLLGLAINSEARYTIGVDYGQLGDNLPSPKEAIELIKSRKIGKVKIYDANPAILEALANTEMKVSVMVTNQEIAQIASSQAAADEWIKHNVTRYYSKTRIRTVLVGNEILSDYADNQTWFQLVPAMSNIHTALKKRKLHHIKVSTPLAMDMLQGSIFPPSNGTFRTDIAESVMKPMLRFLDRTRSSIWIDVYPFFARENDPQNISLAFALFAPDAAVYTDVNGLQYHNLLDVQLDAVVAAMAKLGYENIKLTISETGWPTREDLDERGANIYNAALYNRRLVRKALANPPLGTPRRPRELINTYIFALFNENLKSGPTTERNWGLLYPNGSCVYQIDLTGKLQDWQYPPLPLPPPEPAPGTLKLWCVANAFTDPTNLAAALSYACGPGLADCKPIQPGQSCFFPNNTVFHASYAFNAYYSKFKKIGGTCIFNGAANLTTHNPSHRSCKFIPTYY
eukprot:c17813_g1_i2 orf=552-1958(+)